MARRVLSEDEAAKLLGVSRFWLDEMMWQGTLCRPLWPARVKALLPAPHNADNEPPAPPSHGDWDDEHHERGYGYGPF